MSGNKLNGSIPSWIGEMKKLQRMDLSQNQLTGDIPVSGVGNAIGLNNLTYIAQM